MSTENKKLLWIAIAVVAVILVVAIVGTVVFYPKKGGAQAPAAAGNLSAPKAADPQEYLNSQGLTPQATPAAPSDGDVIVIYGDKPNSLQVGPTEGAAAIAATAGAAIDPSKPALGSGETPTATTATPATTSAKATAAPASAAPKAAAPKPASATAKPASAKPAVAKAAPKTDEFWIQAASFTSRAKAEELKDSLSKKGLAALVTMKEISSKNWYRVRVGPYASNAEATGWLAKIKGIQGCEEAGIWKSAK